MSIDPTLTAPLAMTYSHDLESAGWMMARSRTQKIASVELWEYKGKAHLTCHFQTEPGGSLDFNEYVKEKTRHPGEFRKTLADGLTQLTVYLNKLLADQENAPALNTKKEAAHE